jgi:hypothetical protein
MCFRDDALTGRHIVISGPSPLHHVVSRRRAVAGDRPVQRQQSGDEAIGCPLGGRSFARELADQGIRANAVAPGIVSVGLAKRQWDIDPRYRARAQKAIPLGQMQPLDSVANAFLFLCSPAAEYMTGSVLLVDGGCSLYPMD